MSKRWVEVTKVEMAKRRKKRISNELQTVLDYILEHEEKDYVEWCFQLGYDIDDADAVRKHVYGSACKVLGRKPSYFITREVSDAG